MKSDAYFVTLIETGIYVEVAQGWRTIPKRFISNHCANRGVDKSHVSATVCAVHTSSLWLAIYGRW
jgi:hypothetical protein